MTPRTTPDPGSVNQSSSQLANQSIIEPTDQSISKSPFLKGLRTTQNGGVLFLDVRELDGHA